MSTFYQTMRVKDRLAFRDAAASQNCWILVRAINPSSIRYLDDPQYTPKPIDCKPKTADADCGGKNLAGLVIVPGIHGAPAFRGGKFSKALDCWNSFLKSQNVAPCSDGKLNPKQRSLKEADALNRSGGDYQVDVDERSRHFGCLKFQRKWIHGDYDLKDIILEGQEQRNLAAVEEMRGQAHMRGPRVYKVRDFVNTRLGKPLIQHGGEAQYADHTDDTIDVFGPKGQHTQLSGAAEIAQWYQSWERETIDRKKSAPQAVPDPKQTPEQLRAQFRVLPGGKH
jgi:hypothetical protein